MFDRFERGSISWQELRTISSELSFSSLVDALRTEAGLGPAPPLGAMPEEQLSFKAFRRLLQSKHVAAQLGKESSHHTSTYQYKVIEKVIQMLIHNHLEMTDLSEARLAYNFHSQQAWGVPFKHQTLIAALRLAKHAIAPDQLQTWMDAAVSGGKIELHAVTEDSDGEAQSFIQFFEFLDLFVLCDPINLERFRNIRQRDPKHISKRERVRASAEVDFPNSIDLWRQPEVSKTHSSVASTQQRTKTPHRGEPAPLIATNRYDLHFPQSEHFFKQYADGKAKDDTGAYNLAEDEFLMTPSERLGSSLNANYTTRVREHRRQLLNDRTAKELQDKYKNEERQKLRGSKVAAKEELFAEILNALDESSETVTASRVAFRPAARRKALDRTHQLRQSLSRAGMAPAGGRETSLSNVRRVQSVGSIGLSTGRGEGGGEWGSAMDDSIPGEAKAMGVGAAARDPTAKRTGSAPPRHDFDPGMGDLQPQWFEEDVLDTGGLLPSGLAPHGGSAEEVPAPPSTVPHHMKKASRGGGRWGGAISAPPGDMSGRSQQKKSGTFGRAVRASSTTRRRQRPGSDVTNLTLLQKQRAMQIRAPKAALAGKGGPKLSANSTELTSFSLDICGSAKPNKSYPYFG